MHKLTPEKCAIIYIVMAILTYGYTANVDACVARAKENTAYTEFQLKEAILTCGDTRSGRSAGASLFWPMYLSAEAFRGIVNLTK